MHPVLLGEGACVKARRSQQTFKETGAQTPDRSFLREHGWRQLLVISNENGVRVACGLLQGDYGHRLRRLPCLVDQDEATFPRPILALQIC